MTCDQEKPTPVWDFSAPDT